MIFLGKKDTQKIICQKNWKQQDLNSCWKMSGTILFLQRILSYFFYHQVPREGLKDAKLDWAPGESAQRSQDPDTQPVSGDQLRVPGMTRIICFLRSRCWDFEVPFYNPWWSLRKDFTILPIKSLYMMILAFINFWLTFSFSGDRDQWVRGRHDESNCRGQDKRWILGIKHISCLWKEYKL